ncbi:MAG: tetraacyldisaccharide 4'-kinase [Pelagibacteraceae bacterium TMED287]|nr:MAG: tetraacyldisaccharide 4'-kinase [Pelagibacteraceae bacterium TMED287]
MKLSKPGFWEKKNSIISILLLPISLLFQVLYSIKKIIIKKKTFSIPIICVGNIYVGGTGKTPLAIKIFKGLSKTNIKPIIVKKFYNDQKDEAQLIKEKTGNIIQNKSRAKAIKSAIEQNFDLVILDDGFQDKSIEKSLNILCFNSEQLIGNGFTLPSGPLREPFSAIEKSQIIIINGSCDEKFEKKIYDNSHENVKIFYTKYLPLNVKKLSNMDLLAFAGIGNPENFFKLLTNYNLKLKKKISYPDHYEYKKKDVEYLLALSKKNNLRIVTTEKDFSRLNQLGLSEGISCLSVELGIQDEEEFFNEIRKYIK